MRESTPKPQKRISAQETTITTSGQDTGLASCSEISSLVCSIALAAAAAVGRELPLSRGLRVERSDILVRFP